MSKRLKSALVCVISALMLIAFSAFIIPFVKPAAATSEQPTYTADSFVMKEGASVRIDEKSGIRFKTIVGNNVIKNWGDISTWGETYKIGTLFIPEDILTSYQKTVDDLVIDATFGDYAVENVECKVWGEDSTADYKVFNACLTDLEAMGYTKNVVARSYYIDETGTHYVTDARTFSVAYIAAKALDNGEEGAALDEYVKDLEKVEFEKTAVNVLAGDSATFSATATPAVFPVNYSVTGGGVINGTNVTANIPSEITVTASVAGGKKTAEMIVNSIGGLAVYTNKYNTFYANDDTVTGTLDITYYGEITAVAVNGSALTTDDYTVGTNLISINKSAIVAKSTGVDNTITINETFDIPVQVGGGYTTFDADSLTNVIASTENVAKIEVTDETSKDADGKSLKITLSEASGKIYIANEYLKTLFDMPYVTKVRFYSATEAGSFSSNTLARFSFDELNGENWGINVSSDTLYIDEFIVYMDDSNNIFYYDTTITEGLTVSGLMGTPTKAYLAGTDFINSTNNAVANGNSLTITNQRLYRKDNVAGQEYSNATFRFDTDKAVYIASLYTTNTADDFNYVNVTAGSEELYTYTLPDSALENAVIEKATINGVDVTTIEGIAIDGRNITFKKGLLYSNYIGHNTLIVDVVESSSSSFVRRHYYEDLVFADESKLSAPITFEDGKISPYINVVGVISKAEVVDSTVMGSHKDGETYAVNRAYTKASDSSTVNNLKVLKTNSASSINIRIYIDTAYIKARADGWDLTYDYWKGKYEAEIGWYFCMRIDSSDKDKTWIVDGASVTVEGSTTSSFAYSHQLFTWNRNGVYSYGLLGFQGYEAILDTETHTQVVKSYYCCEIPGGNREYYFDDIAGYYGGVTTTSNVKI